MMSIGQRIRKARQQKKLSLQELALKAGCADEFLEWVEEGHVEPPVALLLQLAKALRLDSNTFLGLEDSKVRRQVEGTKRTQHYSYTTLTPKDGDHHLMAFSITIPPKTAHEGVGYKHEGEEFVYVVSGEVALKVDQDILRLKRKQFHQFNSNLDHHLSNPGSKPAELLVILHVP